MAGSIDPIDACERVAAGLFAMADLLNAWGSEERTEAQLRLLADSIESDRDQADMQALAMTMVEEVGTLCPAQP